MTTKAEVSVGKRPTTFVRCLTPVWTPKYLASPGGLALPGILADVIALISELPHELKAVAIGIVAMTIGATLVVMMVLAALGAI